MTVSVRFNAQELSALTLERSRTEISTFPFKPLTPDNFSVVGRKFGFYITWSKVDGVDGYQIAVMTGNDLSAPQLIIEVPGKDTMQYSYTVGDVAAARTFSVQSYKSSINGERLYSEWYYPLATATSKVDGGAADAAPVAPPAQAPTPDTGEFQGDPGGIPKIEVA